MRLIKWLSVFAFAIFLFASCKIEQRPLKKGTQIAFISDVHFSDIFGTFEDVGYHGIPNPKTGKYANIRTMESQLHSTRIFNENYFAFIAALDEIVEQGVKIVALPGDFSDDGQPIHVKGLRKILDDYSAKHGLSFFIATGNHDVVRPFTRNDAKTDFLGAGGKEQIITSYMEKLPVDKSQLKPIITSEIKNWGYEEILGEMKDFGFYPKKPYLYWETPFSTYTYDDYHYMESLRQSALENRTYAIKDTNLWLPDASYLVEPVNGVWLLSIDANAYVPNKTLSGALDNPKDFSGASIGYNNVLIYKKHLIDWVKKVSHEAKKKDKILIAFSHYPMVDFNDNASSEMISLFGEDKMQLHRVPKKEVAEAFANAGIQIHFGGHMHINDTGIEKTKEGHTLFNIQTPSLAAYMPAYKILTINTPTELEVETKIVEEVSKYNSLFPFYEEEYAFLKASQDSEIWNRDVLTAKSYKDFMEWHLKELVRLRFMPEDFPDGFLKSFTQSTGKELLLLHGNFTKVETELMSNNLELTDFETWTGEDMVFDFFRIRSADELALTEIGKKRREQYQLVCQQLISSDNAQMVLWGTIFLKCMKGMPSNHFKMDLNSGEIIRIPI